MSHPGRHPLSSALRALASLRITVVLLSLAIWLVFWATVGMKDLGIEEGVRVCFRQFFAYFDFRTGGGWDAATGVVRPAQPVFRMWMPGGYLIGSAMLLNLLAAYLTRFKLRWSKLGIHMIHLGIAVILLGELWTGLSSVETQMILDEGETKNYSEVRDECELALVDVTDPGRETHFAIPRSRLEKGAQIAHPGLPFRVEVVEFLGNADIQPGGEKPLPGYEPVAGDQGLARMGLVWKKLPRDATMAGKNFPVARVRLHEGSRCLGTWIVSTQIPESQPVTSADSRHWELALRLRREYKPFSLTLRDFQRNLYPGTTIAKDYSSFVTLTEKGLEQGRDVRIWMNHPLRHAGYTFYQSSFINNDTTTILQVVRNPSWLIPYIACVVMTLGLVIQFGIHLTGFIAKRRRAETA